jgi:serine/threonine protein kinase
MEYSEESLAEELLRRRRLTRDDPGKWMSEPEMWYVIRSVASASSALEQNGLLHGDIQPRHILITNDETIKLFEAPLLSQYFTGANRMLQEQDYHAAVSPQELDALRNDLVYRTLNPGIVAHNVGTPVTIAPVDPRNMNNADQRTSSGDTILRSHLQGSFPDYNVRHIHNEKDEVFSLGITALCAACNNPLADFYDYKTVELNRPKIAQKIAFMRELGYSQELINLISGMLQEDPNQRLSMSQVLQIVSRPHTVINTAGGMPTVIGASTAGGPIGNPSNFATSTVITPGQQQQFNSGQQQQFNPGMSNFLGGANQVQPQRPVGPNAGLQGQVATPGFAGQGSIAPQSGFAGQGATVPQGGFAGQGATVPQGGFAGQGATVPQGGFAGQGATVPQGGFAGQGATVPQGGFAGQGATVPQGGFAGQGATVPQGGFAGQGATVPQGGFAGQGATVPQGGFAGQGAVVSPGARPSSIVPGYGGSTTTTTSTTYTGVPGAAPVYGGAGYNTTQYGATGFAPNAAPIGVNPYGTR